MPLIYIGEITEVEVYIFFVIKIQFTTKFSKDTKGLVVKHGNKQATDSRDRDHDVNSTAALDRIYRT